MLTFYNTLTRKKEIFAPLNPPSVGLYTCGPTVYNYAHIGNLRTYIFEDLLKRTLEYNGYSVNHIMNITDVGHLTSDADEGEDKMEKGAIREGKTAWEIAEFYTLAFKKDMSALGIIPPNTYCKATDNIPEQIAMVQTLIDKGYTYETSDGIYFDTTKLTDYGKLANLKKQTLKAGARIDMGDKKNPHDFALWKFSPVGETRQMEWRAFEKMGFPGWHIECSAMSVKYLGNQFDIHCGGIDHVPVHHTNEIAQTEAATGIIPWVRFWMHGEFLNIQGGDKMAKSGENFITLNSLIDKNFNPICYRYFLLQTHYRKQVTFSWEALTAAKNGLSHLCDIIENLGESGIGCAEYENKFINLMNDDLNTPEALALLWDLLKSDNPDSAKKATALKFDKILGLGLASIKKEQTILPPQVAELAAKRAQARTEKNWLESDRLRDEILKSGFTIKDTENGQQISKT